LAELWNADKYHLFLFLFGGLGEAIFFLKLAFGQFHNQSKAKKEQWSFTGLH